MFLIMFRKSMRYFLEVEFRLGLATFKLYNLHPLVLRRREKQRRCHSSHLYRKFLGAADAVLRPESLVSIGVAGAIWTAVFAQRLMNKNRRNDLWMFNYVIYVQPNYYCYHYNHVKLWCCCLRIFLQSGLWLLLGTCSKFVPNPSV